MSKEAIGENWFILGSSGYWERVNRETIFGRMMQDASDTNYQQTLQEMGSRANEAVEEIYDDLQEHIKSVRAIPSDHRNELAKQVQELYDVCSMAGTFCSHSSECKGILELSGFYLPDTSFSDDRAIQNAIHKIKNCPDFFASECIDLIRQAADWGISFAAGSDARKNAFLKDISQGKDREFLRDVLDSYHSSGDAADLRGSCGYSIGSREYRDYMERKVFLQDLPAMHSDDYDGALRDALGQIADQLRRDLERNEQENNYITDETAERLREAVRELERCGASVGFADSAIDRLAWFVGGDADEILKIQQLLNATGFVNLTEDGVYGPKTQEAEEHIVNRFRDHLEEVLLDEAAVKYITARISTKLGSMAVMRSSPLRDYAEILAKILFDSRKPIQRLFWRTGAELFRHMRGYDVAAFLVEHSLETVPSNLYCSQNHQITQKVMQSESFKEAYEVLEKNIRRNPDVYAVSGNFGIDFEKKSKDRDLYLGIGKCTIDYTCTRTDSTVVVYFKTSDEYNFDELRLFSGGTEQFIEIHRSFGNLANDLGFLSQADGVMHPYTIQIEFQKTIDL